MLNRFLIVALFVLFNISLKAQTCTPLLPTGLPGVTPPTENLACIERGIPFSETIHIENFNTFNTSFGTAQLNYLIIDSFKNLPCDLLWSISPSDSLGPAETGCISIYGTTYDAPGQYRIRIYVTVSVTIGSNPPIVMSNEAEALVQQVEQLTGTPTGVNFKYYLRVIQPGALCPVLDTTAGAPNVVACTPLSATINSADTICFGYPTMMSAVAAGGVPPYTYKWSPPGIFNNDTIATPTVNSNSNFTASVKVFDDNGDSVTVSKPIIVEVCPGISDNIIHDFLISPNPSNGKFYLAPMNNKENLIQIYSVNGKLIYERWNFNHDPFFEVDLSEESRGIYLVKLISDSATGIKRIVLQ